MFSKSNINRKYGWHPGLPDCRAIKYSTVQPVHMASTLPSVVDLRGQLSKPYDQGDLGSCTANASAGLAEFLLRKGGKPTFVPSRLFIYYNERVLENTINEDSGASLTDAMKVLSSVGSPHESMWWYNVAKYTVKPSKKVYTDAANHKVSGYMALDGSNVNELKSCLASGYPFMLGFTVYESFESQAVAETGVVPMPGGGEEVLGGHAILAVGYDDTRNAFIIRNSWGTEWGIGGYCYMPYAFLTNQDLCADFWTAHAIA